MTTRFVRIVRAVSGAVAVQVLTQVGRVLTEVEHVGSAHSDTELELLLHAAQELLNPGQGMLELGPIEAVPAQLPDVSDWTTQDKPVLPVVAGPGRPKKVSSGSRVTSTAALTLWNVLLGVYNQLGFDVLGDEAFRPLVLARIIEPTSKADTVRVLKEHRRTKAWVEHTVPSTRTVPRT